MKLKRIALTIVYTIAACALLTLLAMAWALGAFEGAIITLLVCMGAATIIHTEWPDY